MMVSKQTQAPSEIPMCEAPMFFLACYRHVRGIGHIYDATALGGAHPTVFCELLRLVAPAFGRWHHAHERKWNTKEDPWPTPEEQGDGARLLQHGVQRQEARRSSGKVRRASLHPAQPPSP